MARVVLFLALCAAQAAADCCRFHEGAPDKCYPKRTTTLPASDASARCLEFSKESHWYQRFSPNRETYCSPSGEVDGNGEALGNCVSTVKTESAPEKRHLQTLNKKSFVFGDASNGLRCENWCTPAICGVSDGDQACAGCHYCGALDMQ